MTEHLERYATSLFGDVKDSIDLLIDSYKDLYDLPNLEKMFEVATDDSLPFLARRNFLLVCAYDRLGRFLTINKSKKSLRILDKDSRLIGRTIDDYSSFCLEQTANEMVARYTGGYISDLRPVCKMVNRFGSPDEFRSQNGIVFMALVDGILPEKVDSYEISFGNIAPETMIFQNREALTLAMKMRNTLNFFPDPEEIEHAPNGFRSRIHKLAVKPLVKRHSSSRIRKAIFTKIGTVNSVIDVSCGDDETIFSISEALDPDLVVANDINWSAMKATMAKARDKNYHILFTNHHVCEMPFKQRFDIALCKNTLHHIPNANELVKALGAMKMLAKRLIIVDIEDPRRSKAGRLFNRYYENFLGDGADDHNFLTKKKFRNLISRAYPEAEVGFEDIRTIKGRYMLADVKFAD
jgi:2-polyprenyl-3-methyl-5-hydroxy-6-metoxy-1,4-benzoquinol methylase